MLKWCDVDLVLRKYTNNSRHVKSALNQLMPTFFEYYPTPYDWLNCKEKKQFKASTGCYTETLYIISWMIEEKLWSQLDLQPIFMDYFIAHPNSICYKNIAYRCKLLSPTDILLIRQHDPRIATLKISLICLCLNKKLSELNYDDINNFPSFKDSSNYTPRRMQNLLIALGYSNIKAPVRKQKSTWDTLLNHPLYGDIFDYTYKYLKAGSAKPSYISSMGTSIKYLLKFMSYKKLEDFSQFNAPLFEELINYLEETISQISAGAYIPKIKVFFELNIGSYMFPKTLDFCDLYWSSYTKMLKKINKEKDGFAFSDSNLAKSIVSILKNYHPQNDIELVCKNFWLIIASCPARFTYVLNLQAENAIMPLPNNPNAYGIYSKFADKAGNSYGQFPLLDKIGLDAILELQKRIEDLDPNPLYNPITKDTYIHLFQLPHSPWLLDSNILNKFYTKIVINQLNSLYPNDTTLRATAHSFRHYLITHVALKTGDASVCQTAAGHLDIKMTYQYLRSKASRTSLLFRVMDKFENKEITGKFYLRLIELLSSSETPVDEMLYALTTEMSLDQFLTTYGRNLGMGYCFNNKECYRWYACWGCNNFIITRNEITQAIYTLTIQIIELKNFQQCNDFSYESPMVKNKLKLISLIIKRLTELDLTEETIEKMVLNCIQNKDLTIGVTHIC